MPDRDQGSFWEDVGSGLRRLLGGSWPRDERAFAVLLDLLVRGRKLHDELRTMEADASPVSTREPQAEEAQLVRQELAAARADLPEFERALIDAWHRSGGTTREIAYDCADPAQDRAADVLVRYLVTTRTASVRSEERGEQQYTYYLSVAWDTLFALAAHLEVPLRPALESGADTA